MLRQQRELGGLTALTNQLTLEKISTRYESIAHAVSALSKSATSSDFYIP